MSTFNRASKIALFIITVFIMVLVAVAMARTLVIAFEIIASVSIPILLVVYFLKWRKNET